MIDLCSSISAKEADQKTIARGETAENLMRLVALGVLENAPFREGKTLIVCGKGGNGGDGYCLYLLMKEKGYSVSVLEFGEPQNPAAAFYRAACGEDVLSYQNDFDFSAYANIVDCIFGIGLSRPVSGDYLECIKKINASKAFVVSVDIASGLSADSGKILGAAVEADVTFAVQNLKLGHFLSDGLDCSGEIGVLPVGIDPATAELEMIEDEDVAKLFPPLKRNVHKGNLGRLSILAGSDSFSGAAVLAEMGAAAFALGDGLVKLCVPDSILYSVMNKITECTLLALPSADGKILFSEPYLEKAISGASAVLFGNGVDLSENGAHILRYLVKNVKCPLVLDADGLNLLSSDPFLLKERAGTTVVTPHPKELSRLLGVPVSEILSEPLSYAKEFAARFGVTVLLKGASTIVTDGKRAYLSKTGSPGMAKGGSGDLLAGAIAAMLAGGRDPIESAYGAAYVLGVAGEYASEEVGAYSSLPSDTARYIAKAVKFFAEKVANNT